MTETCFLSERFDGDEASNWAQGCAERNGWSAEEAGRLASCVSESARAVSERAYATNDSGPVFVRLDMAADSATLEMHHEGALGDKPCDCAAAQVATERRSTNWTDAQLRTHKLRIERA